MKKFLVVIVIFALIFSFSGCSIFFIPKTPDVSPDKTGSWGAINQNIFKAENWKQIVGDSPFKLGEKSVRGTWQVPNGTQEYYEIGCGTYPVLDGSTVAVPMAMEFARQHLGIKEDDLQSFVFFSTTHYAYEYLINKMVQEKGMIQSETTFLEASPVDLIIATEPSDEERKMAADAGVEMIIEPVCYDAFVFITHKDNPVDSLTVEQIQKIYSGEITNWSEVGGKDEEIIAYQREKNSGSQTAMELLVMQGKPMIEAPLAKIVMGMGGLIDSVAEYKNETCSIGYTYKYYIDTLYKNDNIKTISVNGVSPITENIRGKTYPFTTNYYGVIRSTDTEARGGKFLSWMLSDEGQACIEQAGYIPMKAK